MLVCYSLFCAFSWTVAVQGGSFFAPVLEDRFQGAQYTVHGPGLFCLRDAC